ncbi:MAG: non-ribosomal peptide synthetase, partial [bacterium]|nr:non-ribosomal peptide synthetase [bacterium]
DSIKAIQAATALLDYRLKVEIHDIFANPTIKQLAAQVKRQDRIIDQGPVEGEVLLTPIQRWFFDSDFTDRHYFNMAVMLYKEDRFDETILEQVFTRLIEHHDALRMVFKERDGKTVQLNRGQAGKLFDLSVFNLEDGGEDIESAVEKEACRIQGSIDLQEGPLVKLGLFKTGEGDHLLMVIHHSVVDGVSWRLLIEDFADGYRRVSAGEPVKFPKKTDSFQTWAAKLAEYAQSSTLLNQAAYWQTVEQAQPDALPRDNETGIEKKKLKNLETVTLVLEAGETETLLQNITRAYNTEINDILLAALGLALKEWANIETPAVTLEGHGREAVIAGLEINRTAGWFTTQFPVILDMKHSDDLSYQVRFIKETLRKIPGKGFGYGVLKHLTPASKKTGLTFTLEPQISFNYLGEFDLERMDEVFRMSGLKTGDGASPELERPLALAVNGIILEKKLHFHFTYNKYEYLETTMERLVDCYKTNLTRIVEHCMSKEEKELTPSDVAQDEELSIEELDDIKSMLNI